MSTPLPASRNMSRTATFSSDGQSDESPSRTLTDLTVPVKGEVPVESTIGETEKSLVPVDKAGVQAAADALSSLPPFKKTLAYITFCLAMFM